MSTIFDKRLAVSVTKTTELLYLIRKITQIAELSVVIPAQSNYMKLVYMASLSLIPQCYPDLTAYVHEILTANNPEQQNNTLWFPTLENPGEPEDHTPIKTRTLGKLNELKEKKTPFTREHRIPNQFFRKA